MTNARLPLTALRSFEAAARLLSFKAAAEELRVTPASVSNQIRQLERDWNCPLFVRKTRQIELTDAGRALAQSCQRAFGDLQLQIAAIRALSPQRSNRVSLAVGPLFGSRFLIPRLASFRAEHPRIELALHQGQHITQAHQLDTDVAIDWGQGGPTEWPGLDAQRLLEVAYVPVLSPALLKERGPLKTASDLAQLPIVHQQTKDDWHAWFALNGQPAISLAQETVMADSNMAMQAAVDGHGVALGALAMVQSDLDAGRLVCPFHTPLRPGQAYFLLSRSGARKAPAVQALWDWLLAQSADAQV